MNWVLGISDATQNIIDSVTSAIFEMKIFPMIEMKGIKLKMNAKFN